jgi:LmbE family N-acetylglucosaminyl deacetylase
MMKATRKLLAILAHPDDESLGIGSTLAKYAAEGVETFLICATKGERGWTGEEKDYPGLSGLGKTREQELLNAAEVLGIQRVCFLDYLDGDLDQADAVEAIGKITAIMREVQPQVVVTFAPDGAYGHPDHIAISQFAAAACVLAADQSYVDAKKNRAHQIKKFYYFVNSSELIKNYTGVFGNIEMQIDGVARSMVSWPDWSYTTMIDATDHWKTALKAVNCHVSQVGIYGDLNLLSEEKSIELWGKRTYYRVFSLVNGGRRIETDLFEGIQ